MGPTMEKSRGIETICQGPGAQKKMDITRAVSGERIVVEGRQMYEKVRKSINQWQGPTDGAWEN